MSSSRLIDISQAVSSDSAVWPGDTPFSHRWTWDMSEGSSCNVSAVNSSPHVGTHADAPLHFDPKGDSIGEVDLHRYCGPCWVLNGPEHGLVSAADLELVDLAKYPRVLLRTRRQQELGFPEDFSALSPEAAGYLAETKAALVGLDTPSVDPFDSKDLPAHHILNGAGVALLENLVLHHVEPGPYELLALPLKWMGLDASPVRAVLRR